MPIKTGWIFCTGSAWMQNLAYFLLASVESVIFAMGFTALAKEFITFAQEFTTVIYNRVQHKCTSHWVNWLYKAIELIPQPSPMAKAQLHC